MCCRCRLEAKERWPYQLSISSALREQTACDQPFSLPFEYGVVYASRRTEELACWARFRRFSALGVWRIVKLASAYRKARSVSVPFASQNSAAWSANASRCFLVSSSYRATDSASKESDSSVLPLDCRSQASCAVNSGS